MARTTPFTEENQKVLDLLRADNRVQNERPCGCFDIRITNNYIQLVPCDDCAAMLKKIGVGVVYGTS